MAGISAITVNKGSGGLGRRPASNDGVSAFIFYNASPPTGFATDNIQQVFSLEEAEDLGIVDTAAAFEVYHYQVSEFFRINPTGTLWIGFFGVPVGAPDFAEIGTMQAFAQGAINIFGIYASDFRTYADSDVDAAGAEMDAIEALNQPAICLLAEDLSAVLDANIATLTDLRTKSEPDVAVLTHQDGDASSTGAALFTSKGYSIQALGATMGATSKAAVQQSIGNPENFNLLGTELLEPAFGNGTLNKDLTTTVLSALIDRGYTIMRDYLPNLSGTYSERMPMAVALTSDYAFVENRRVVHKAQRLLVSAYLPKLNSNVFFNEDGTITDISLEALKDVGTTVIEAMQAAGNISQGEVIIDPAQDVLSTSTLEVSARILPVGVAQYITININLVPSLT